jgi:hypothetical protein
MPLTFGDARKLLAPYAGQGGKCETSEDVRLFVYEVLQYMLFSGQYGARRLFTFNAIKGCITLPYELEVPEKVRMDGVVGQVWNRWYDFSASTFLENTNEAVCFNAGDALIEDPNEYPTVYDVPECGSKVGVQCDCQQPADAHIIVKGIDLYGREVFTTHKGEKVSGEYLGIKKGNLTYSQTVFKKITGIYKSDTEGYVSLWWVNTDLNTKGFLAEYSPKEHVPAYRRYRFSKQCGASAKINVLGKIRLKDYYADTDKIPFDNIVSLKTAAQSRNNMTNKDVQTAVAQDQFMQTIINRENSYKSSNVGQPIDINISTSAGTIRGIINRRVPWSRGGWGWFGGNRR